MPSFPEGVVAFQLSADIALEDFGGGLCLAGDTEVDLGELVHDGDGFIATARPGLIDLLACLAAFERVHNLDDVPTHALVDDRFDQEDLNPLDHPGSFKVEEVIAALQGLTDEQVAGTLALESLGKKRTTILNYEPPAPAASGEGNQGTATGDADTTTDNGQ